MQSRFSNLASKAVKSGRKVSGGSKPVLTLSSPKDKFDLNLPAFDELGLGSKEKDANVVLFDLGTDSEDINTRFAIAKGYEVDGELQGAKVGKNRSFSYSGIYSAMLKGDVEVRELTAEEMLEQGLMIKRENKSGSSYLPLKRVKFDLVPITDKDGDHLPIVVAVDEEGEEVKALAWQLVNRRESATTPKGSGDDTDDTTDEETIED